jgi:hypothetical protein
MKLLVMILVFLQFTCNAFAKRQPSHDTAFAFQKIFFATFGSGQIHTAYANTEFMIDSSGAMQFTCYPDTGKLIGTYKGLLSAAQRSKLMELIRQSAPEQFAIAEKGLTADAPLYIFRFYFNNKMTEAIGHRIPHLGKPLADYLETLIDTVHLERVSGEYHQNVMEVIRSR